MNLMVLKYIAVTVIYMETLQIRLLQKQVVGTGWHNKN